MGDDPAGYPDELEREVAGAEGLRYHVRPIRPDDAARLVAFHRHLSPHSVYLRFFTFHPTLTDAEVARFTTVDYVDRLALVATVGDRIIAVGRFDRAPGGTEAEVAFVVADEYQHHGIGSLLLDELARAALAAGSRGLQGRDAGREQRHARRVPPRRVPGHLGHRVRDGDAALPDHAHRRLPGRAGGTRGHPAAPPGAPV